MKTNFHQGRCEGGLYPLVASSSGASQNKLVFEVSKPSTLRWHNRLGPLTLPIVKSVLRNNELLLMMIVLVQFVIHAQKVIISLFFPSDKLVDLSLLYY